MRSNRNDLPEYDVYGQLWLAVLALAVEDATSSVEPIPNEGRPSELYTEDQWIQRRARLWIDSKSREAGSLEWICTMLNINAEAVREEYTRRLTRRDNTAGQDRISYEEATG